ncbi:MAG: NAD(P)/FAD-dependent oxidoreductase [Thermodesulfobacteriota bacterium]
MKVTIIGASISGLFSAYLLAKEGIDVEVYEKRNALGLPSRTLIVTSKINDVLNFVPEEAIVNKVRYLELFSRSRSARIKLSQPDLIVEREKLANLLARLAEGVGAKIVLVHQVEGFAQLDGKIVVSLKNLEKGEERRISTDILIGADGVLSTVNRVISRNGHDLKALLQARVRLPESMSSDTCKVWFDSNQTKYFYWLIPESDQVAAVGLIADDDHQAEKCLRTFLWEKDLEPLEFQAAMVPMHRFEWRGGVQALGRNIFIVGDAAAQVKVTTVGGVVTGLYGAKALTNALLNGRNYRKELRGLRLELDLHLLVRNVLNRFGDENYDELIGMLNGRLKEILENRTRDELRHSFLRLIWNEPRLIMLGTKALLKSML